MPFQPSHKKLGKQLDCLSATVSICTLKISLKVDRGLAFRLSREVSKLYAAGESMTGNGYKPVEQSREHAVQIQHIGSVAQLPALPFLPPRALRSLPLLSVYSARSKH